MHVNMPLVAPKGPAGCAYNTWKKLQLPETEARGATGSGSGKRLRRVAVGRRVEVTEKVLVMFNQI